LKFNFSTLLSSFFILTLLFPREVFATDDYHFVGWFNTFVPGGGQFLMGYGWDGAAQAAFEIGTFGIGYDLSARTSFNIDGVPQDYPAVTTNLGTTRSGKPRRKGVATAPIELIQPSSAAFLQEVGIKAHMVDVFDSYREAYGKYGGDEGQGIDTRTDWEMFKDPFKWDVISSPWVWIPTFLVAGFTVIDYSSQVQSGLPQIQQLNTVSNSFVGFNQLALYPIGSGAPEEMFYRGFLQNEAFHWVHSPFFAVPLSSLAFSFSHSPDGRLGALASGLYLGTLAYKNHGNLSQGIAVHFWSVVILGIESLALTLRSEKLGRPIGSQVSFFF
jgi:membrane protease YdiL (CAAX protease family)